MVLWSIENAWGGEILVPKIPSYRITDVAEAVAPGAWPSAWWAYARVKSCTKK